MTEQELAPPLDCLIVGYNDVDFRRRMENLKVSRLTSAGFNALHLQSLPVNGQRLTYMEVLNEALKIATDRDYALHIGDLPSLGAWYLRTFLAKNGYRADVINLFNKDKERLSRLLKHEPPLAVAITTTFYIDDAPIREVVDFVKSHSPETKLIVGGPHVFNRFQEIENKQVLKYVLASMGADVFIYDSQGELTLARVLSHLKGDSSAETLFSVPKSGKHETNSQEVFGADARVKTCTLHEIPNIAFFEDGELVTTSRSIESNDMDLYSVDWDLVETKHFVPTATTRTARSCAFSCAFCRYPVIAGPLNLKSIEAVITQFDQFQRHGVRQVIIIDDTFNVPLSRFKELCRAVASHRYDFEWYSYLRPANLDAEALDLIAESGCGGCFLGIESGDSGILKAMNKAVTVERYVHGVQELNARGVTTFASLIVGYPGETRASVDNTIAFVEEAQPTYWRAGLYFHPKDAPVSRMSEEYGITGFGYSWSHSSMTWQQGLAEIHRMMTTVRNSTYLPGYNFDIWGLPYLVGKGISKAQHLAFNRMAQALMIDELNGDPIDDGIVLQRFASLFREDECRSTT